MQRLTTSIQRQFSQRFRDQVPRLRTLVARQGFSAILMVMGIGLLGYAGSEYWAMHREQLTLHRRWEQQQPISERASNPSQDDGLTRVTIPKINLDLIVLEGTDYRALRLGPGHLHNTPAPGDLGNSVISAHRDTFFRHIYELTPGDEIQVRRRRHAFTFQVSGKKIVGPNDISVVKNTADARLTLITCYPIYYVGPAPKRLVVFSKLVRDEPAHQQDATSASNARHGS